MVNCNPLTAKVRSRRVELEELRATMADLLIQINSNDVFDPSEVAGAAEAEARMVASLDIQLAELDRSLTSAHERAEGVLPATLAGWNPSYWFSETRFTAKRTLAQYLDEIEKTESNFRRYSDERRRAVDSLTSAQESLERYSMFDRGEAAAGLDHLGDEFELKSAECEKWEIREKALGVELEVPLRHFLDLQTQLDRLKSDLKTAKKLERELGEATDRFALRQIHEECERRFNTGSPREVIKRTGRAIESLERNTDKLERRLRQIARRGSLDIAKLVIDGSNLCYEEGKLIGLYALRAVCARVPDDIDLIVFFDSSIRKKLGVSDDKLRSQLPGVSMHVVASGAGADESILHAAQAPGSFVLSNDRFADFPEKSAVNEGRIIRHEIVNGCVRIEDLSIEVKYDDRGRLRAP